MSNSDEKKNQALLEKILETVIKKIFIRAKLGLADWDFDDNLRAVLQEPSRLTALKDLIKKYDDTFALSMKGKTKLNPKYKVLYKLETK
jgi:hypothetical protein